MYIYEIITFPLGDWAPTGKLTISQCQPGLTLRNGQFPIRAQAPNGKLIISQCQPGP